MKNPLKHQSAPAASRHSPPSSPTSPTSPASRTSPTSPTSLSSHRREHGYSHSFGSIFQSLSFRKRPESQSSPPEAADHFRIVHLPDRPVVPIRPSQAPSEENCRLILQGLHPGSNRSSHSTTREKPPGQAPKMPANASFAARMARATAQPTPASKPASTPVRRPALRRVAGTSVASRSERVSSATAPTNASRLRQANAGPSPAPPSTRPRISAPLNSARTTYTAPRVAPRPASTRTAASSGGASSRAHTDRALPPLPLSPTRTLKQQPPQNKQQQKNQPRSPPLPLSERPLLPLSPPAEPRRFHMHGETYDKAVAPFKAREKVNAARGPPVSFVPPASPASLTRPSSKSSDRARIGPLTDAEKTRSDGQAAGPDDMADVDIRKYISVGYAPVQLQQQQNGAAATATATATGHHQPQPSQMCLGGNHCRGVLCRVCTPVVRLLHTPEQQAAEEQERRQLQSKSLLARRPDFWSPKYSSPLRQAHPSSPQPGSGDVSPLTPTPPQSPVDGRGWTVQEKPTAAAAAAAAAAVSPVTTPTKDVNVAKDVNVNVANDNRDPPLEWDIEIIRASRLQAEAELDESDDDEPILGYELGARDENLRWPDAPDEPLMPWDIETIKASREHLYKRAAADKKKKMLARQKKMPSYPLPPPPSSSFFPPDPRVFTCWDEDPRANRAAEESSTTALPRILKALRVSPDHVKAKCGVVAIDTVAPKRPQVVTMPSKNSSNKYNNDAEQDEYTGDYTTSWPESAYYFGDRSSMSTIAEHATPTRRSSAATRSTLARSRRQSQVDNMI